MHRLTAQGRELLNSALRNSAVFTCYDWCKIRRYVHAGDFPGWYSSRFHPWVEGPLNSKAPYNYIQKAAQTGLTEVGINRALYELDGRRRDTLYVLPTGKAAAAFSKTRFLNAIKAPPPDAVKISGVQSDYLASQIHYANEVIQLGTATLYIAGAIGDINLKSRPVGTIILDEVDEFSDRAVNLAFERLSGHIHKFLMAFSTPTVPNKGISKLFANSTQEHFFFPCPACGRRIEFRWPDSLVVCGDSVYDPKVADSHLVCYECKAVLPGGGKEIEDIEAKASYLRAGAWEPTEVSRSGDERGFYLNQMYSPAITPAEIAKQYHRSLGDEAAAQELYNSKLGLPYVADGSQINEGTIDEAIARGGHVTGDWRPSAEKIVTLGIDQGKWNYWVACEWQIDKGKAGIEAFDSAICRVVGLGKFAENDWRAAHELMYRFRVLGAVVDLYHQPNEARGFAREFAGYAWPCNYQVGKVAREVLIGPDDFGCSIAKVDRNSWISTVLALFFTGRVALPRDVTMEFRQQLQGLVRTYVRDPMGNYVADFLRVDADHYLHALTYATIGLRILSPDTTDRKDGIEPFF